MAPSAHGLVPVHSRPERHQTPVLRPDPIPAPLRMATTQRSPAPLRMATTLASATQDGYEPSQTVAARGGYAS
jgi:hypothetical protein